MELSALAGNRRLKAQLSQQEGGRGLSHAYIISGPVGSGRHTLGGLLAQAMVCTAPEHQRPCGHCPQCRKAQGGIHPDIAWIAGAGEGKPINVDQVRALRSDAYIRPNEGERKVYILEGADRMNASAQNAMLKLLEEGPAYAAFLLLSENAGGILETVRSRCETLTLDPVAPDECLSWLQARFPQASRDELADAANRCQGLLGRAVEQLAGGGEQAHALKDKADKLARLLVNGQELELLEFSLTLDKLSREDTQSLLDLTGATLGDQILQVPDRARALRAAQGVKEMRQAAGLNVGPAALFPWLCALLFSRKK